MGNNVKGGQHVLCPEKCRACTYARCRRSWTKLATWHVDQPQPLLVSHLLRYLALSPYTKTF